VEAERNDLPNQRLLWIVLAETAIKLNDECTLAEALPALSRTKPNSKNVMEYGARLIGAYRKYGHLDRHPENAPKEFKPTFVFRNYPTAEQQLWNEYFERGKRMSLKEAARYAINL
jgi:hypothetical protein